MNFLGLTWRSLSLFAAVAMIDGCSSPNLHSIVPGSAEPSMSYRRLIPPGMIHSQSNHSWMSRTAKATDLLYVANASGTVTVFSWPGLTLVGVLTGFQEPSALCVDKAQDVFVVDFYAKETYEYAHGGAVPIQSLADPGGFPNACSVDQVTGNLAVTNEFGVAGASSSGNLEIYQGASGTPTERTDPKIFAYWWPAYDNRGDLFFNGFNSSFSTLYTDKIRKGGSVKSVTLNQTFGFPGGLLWDGKYLACIDETVNVIYQFAMSGTSGTMVGSTQLGGANDILQFWVTGRNRTHPEGTTVVGADTNAQAVEVWPYPAGGSSPTKMTTQSLDDPDGVAVSKRV